MTVRRVSDDCFGSSSSNDCFSWPMRCVGGCPVLNSASDRCGSIAANDDRLFHQEYYEVQLSPVR